MTKQRVSLFIFLLIQNLAFGQLSENTLSVSFDLNLTSLESSSINKPAPGYGVGLQNLVRFTDVNRVCVISDIKFSSWSYYSSINRVQLNSINLSSGATLSPFERRYFSLGVSILGKLNTTAYLIDFTSASKSKIDLNNPDYNKFQVALKPVIAYTIKDRLRLYMEYEFFLTNKLSFTSSNNTSVVYIGVSIPISHLTE